MSLLYRGTDPPPLENPPDDLPDDPKDELLELCELEECDELLELEECDELREPEECELEECELEL